MAKRNRTKRRSSSVPTSNNKEHVTDRKLEEPGEKKAKLKDNKNIPVNNHIVKHSSISMREDDEQDIEVDVTTVKEDDSDQDAAQKRPSYDDCNGISYQNHKAIVSEGETAHLLSHPLLPGMKAEDFDSSYEMPDSDLLPTEGISDSMEMPFQDFDMMSVFQFKGESTLNDVVYFQTSVSGGHEGGSSLKLDDLPISSQSSDLNLSDAILGTIKNEPPEELLSESGGNTSLVKVHKDVLCKPASHSADVSLESRQSSHHSCPERSDTEEEEEEDEESSNQGTSDGNIDVESTQENMINSNGGINITSLAGLHSIQGNVTDAGLISAQLGQSSRLAFLLLKDRVIRDDNMVLGNGVVNLKSLFDASRQKSVEDGDGNKMEMPYIIVKPEQLLADPSCLSAANLQLAPGSVSLDASGGLTVTPTNPLEAAKVEDVVDEVDRFVICSDSTMECYLCSFATEDYSAFKSHIICSHPCWRITKKLSKNRLLVEKKLGKGKLLVENSDLKGSGTRQCKMSPKSDPSDKEGEGDQSKRFSKNAKKKQLYERNKRLFKCSKCFRLFVFEGSVVNHVMDHHHESKPYDHIYISNNHGQSFGPIYRCQHKNCYFSCGTEGELTIHNKTNHNNAQIVYRCQLCGYTANNAETVKEHGMQMHKLHLA